MAVRFNDLFMPRRNEFESLVTDYKQCNYQGLTDTEVSNLINDLHKMVPDALRKYIDWDQTRNEQGTWPTKIMVNLWFSNEANMLTRIGLPDVMREELKKGHYTQKDQVVSSRIELSTQRKPYAKAHALFKKGLEEVKGDKSKIHVVYGKIQISFFVGSAIAAKYTPEGEGLAGEGWDIKSDVIAGICTEFSEPFFEAVVNSV